MKILTFDNSLRRTGWAAQTPDGMMCGAKAFPKTAACSPYLRYIEYAGFIKGLFDRFDPDIVLFEEPTPNGFDREALITLKSLLCMECVEYGVPHKSIYPSTLKKLITGSGDADKAAMMAEIASRYENYDPANDDGGDVADAISLLEWHEAGCPLPEKKPKKRKAKPQCGAVGAKSVARSIVGKPGR